jgi:hypothetical protein
MIDTDRFRDLPITAAGIGLQLFRDARSLLSGRKRRRIVHLGGGGLRLLLIDEHKAGCRLDHKAVSVRTRIGLLAEAFAHPINGQDAVPGVTAQDGRLLLLVDFVFFLEGKFEFVIVKMVCDNFVAEVRRPLLERLEALLRRFFRAVRRSIDSIAAQKQRAGN